MDHVITNSFYLNSALSPPEPVNHNLLYPYLMITLPEQMVQMMSADYSYFTLRSDPNGCEPVGISEIYKPVSAVNMNNCYHIKSHSVGLLRGDQYSCSEIPAYIYLTFPRGKVCKVYLRANSPWQKIMFFWLFHVALYVFEPKDKYDFNSTFMFIEQYLDRFYVVYTMGPWI